MSGPVLEIAGLSVALGRRDVLADVSLAVKAREFVAVTGPNGSGKTTLLRAIDGLVDGRGRIAIDGTPLAEIPLNRRARSIAYLPQGNVVHWPLPAEEIVALGRLPQTRGAGLSEADLSAVRDAMARTRTLEFAGRAVTTLSGGERARIAIARVMATGAPLILADEPTAALDLQHQLAVLDLLRRHAEAGGAVVAVLHDLSLAARHADRVVVLDRGRVVADGPPRTVLTPERLAETFGVAADVIEIGGAPWIVATGAA
jgi:iron complex transport system ATP-binding protein